MIEISAISGGFYIWNAQDVVCVREDHRIVGMLVGSLPRLPRQNVQLGLPLQLSVYEARLLLDKGLAQLYDVSDQLSEPTSEDVAAFEASRQRLYIEQLEACKQSRQDMMMKNLERIVDGKRKKMLQARKAVHGDGDGDGDVDKDSKRRRKKKLKKISGEHRTAEDNSDEEQMQAEIRQQIENVEVPVSLPDKAVCVQIHTAEIRCRKNCSSTTEWRFPMSSTDTLKYHVFSYFWEKGYFLTAGGKFGGDFLVYPGDPSRFHSFYIAVCIEHDKSLSVLDLVSLGRLGTSVKKTTVLCSVDNEGQVHCTSLQWSGVS